MKGQFQVIDENPSDDNDVPDVHKPMICDRWQHVQTVNKKGGDVRKPKSAVFLHVPANAVVDNSVDVHVAVCADFCFIYQKLENLGLENEDVSTPLVEYWAGEDFEFRKKVTITLPHVLPKKFKEENVRVYMITPDHYSTRSMKATPVARAKSFSLSHKEDGPSFVVSKDVIKITTSHFSAYVCTYCHKKAKPPKFELYVMCSGLLYVADGIQQAGVFLSV
jgi:hypothetical protein